MKEILVNEEGYIQFFNELDNLTSSLTSNAAHGSEVYGDAVGDGWHDNFAYEDAMRQEKMIQNKINKMLSQKENLKLIDDTKYDDNVVCINDSIEILLKYDDGSEELDVVKLTGKYLPDDDLNEISLNSPIGKAIYNMGIGSDVIYEVSNKKIELHIIRKVILNETN